LLRILTDRGTEYCGKPTTHEYQLFLALNDIEHTKTKARHPQTNGICERFHKTIQNEFYSIAFRRKIYLSIDELQKDLDLWLYTTSGGAEGVGKSTTNSVVLSSVSILIADYFLTAMMY
jgi:transposase InsO family protein